jgi:aminoglycoside 6'-N-acetyltransferase I
MRISAGSCDAQMHRAGDGMRQCHLAKIDLELPLAGGVAVGGMLAPVAHADSQTNWPEVFFRAGSAWQARFMADQAPIVVRPYHPGDRDQVMALAPRLAEGVAAWRDPDAVLLAVQGWVRGSIDAVSQPGRAVYVATDGGGSIAGVVTVGERAHFTGQVDGYVGELVVRAGMERRGIAALLMAAAEAWAASRGHRFLTLETGAANLPARSLYAALGYREEDIRLTRAISPPEAGGRLLAPGASSGAGAARRGLPAVACRYGEFELVAGKITSHDGQWRDEAGRLAGGPDHPGGAGRLGSPGRGGRRGRGGREAGAAAGREAAAARDGVLRDGDGAVRRRGL